MVYNTEKNKEVIALLIKLIEPVENEKETIEKIVMEVGIKSFLNGEGLDHLPQKLKEKIQALSNILRYASESGGALWLK